MLKRVLTVALIGIAWCAAPAAAQDQAQQPAPAPAPATTQAVQPAPTPRPVPSATIRIELTITASDARGTVIGTPKTAVIHVVDRDNGRLRMGRSANTTSPPNIGSPVPVLNVDVQPEILRDGRVRVGLSLEFRPEALPEPEKNEPLHINQRLSAILEDGKPFVVAQSPDAGTDRSVKVQLKATIVK